MAWGARLLKTGIVLVSVASYAALVAAQELPARPPLEGWRLAGEVVAGSYAGFTGYFIGRYIGSRIGDQWFAGPTRESTRQHIKQGLGFTAGAFATAGAVYGIGSIDGQRAEYWTTLAGTGAGFLVAVGVNKLLLPTPREGESSGGRFARRTAEALEILFPSIGATIAFNSTRRFHR